MSRERLRYTINITLALSLVATGGLSMWWLVHTKPQPATHSRADYATEVAVTLIQPQSTEVPIIGYGTVRPKNQISIIPQVSGKLTFVSDDLAPGKIIAEGELLFEINPAAYEARLAQTNAEENVLIATLARLERELINLDQRIANAREILEIDRRDHDTTKRLVDVEHVGTQRDVDLVHQKYLRQVDVVAELTNQRSIGPHVIQETTAKLAAARARGRRASLDLENTKIVCPFNARVESVGAYKSQVVTAHLSIARLTDMAAFEIAVGIDPRDLRWLQNAARPEALEQQKGTAAPPVNVIWSVPGGQSHWQGYLTRFERVDEATRTARMIIEVRDVDMVAIGDPAHTERRLAIGMHTRTELPGMRLEDALLVPRHAIHDGRWVYVVEPDPKAADDATGRLAKRRITQLRTFDDTVLVDYRGRSAKDICELRAGEQVVVSPLPKAVLGMRVRVRQSQLADTSNLEQPTTRLAAARAGTLPKPVVRRCAADG